MILDATFNPETQRYEVTGILYKMEEDDRGKDWQEHLDQIDEIMRAMAVNDVK